MPRCLGTGVAPSHVQFSGLKVGICVLASSPSPGPSILLTTRACHCHLYLPLKSVVPSCLWLGIVPRMVLLKPGPAKEGSLLFPRYPFTSQRGSPIQGQSRQYDEKKVCVCLCTCMLHLGPHFQPYVILLYTRHTTEFSCTHRNKHIDILMPLVLSSSTTHLNTQVCKHKESHK